ncbi:MAG: NAD-dependent epimerase/dehydratase family protein [Halobacteriovoraceae bacterium]|nr:NAD-dependent epimerase/dehydratase family protein [Halobacteriovoraceae bacterium]
MRYFVTGGAGFIGSNMVDRLLEMGNSVTIYDNFSTGHRHFVENALKNDKCTLIEADLLDESTLDSSIAGHDFVFHFAANADVKDGLKHPRKDLEQNTIATFNVLEAMRKNNIKKIAFSSTGSVYGEHPTIPTPEDGAFPIQTSLYATSKVAGEGLISSYAEGFGFTGYIFRFVSILGERYTHGHVFDFYKKLLKDPSQMEVLGNGKQRKSYLYIQDCIDAILTTIDRATENVNIYNLGTDEYCQVNDSINWITKSLGLTPKLMYTGGDRGWVGDNPFIFLDTKKIRSLGWKPKLSIEESILKTLDYLKNNKHLLERV